MFRSAATKLAHNSTIPALAGNNDLRPLQDLILAEKQVLISLQKLGADFAKAAEALRVWGTGEGDDLGDILGASSTLLSLWSGALSQYASHGHAMRDYLKSIRTREENLDELKRRRKAIVAKAESAERKLSKMSPEHKNLTTQTDSLNALRVEIRGMDSDIMTEEATLGDFKRSTSRAWMGVKFGGLLECAEKGTIAGEYGKVIIAEISEEQTQPGMARSLYYGRPKTEQLLSEAHRCISEVQMSTVPPSVVRQGAFQAPVPGFIQQQHTSQGSFSGSFAGQGPQPPFDSPQAGFQGLGMTGPGMPLQTQWAPPPPLNDTAGQTNYFSSPQGFGTPPVMTVEYANQQRLSSGLNQVGHVSQPFESHPQTHDPNQPPARTMDDFGVVNSNPHASFNFLDPPGPGGGRFATFPVKNKGYTLSETPSHPGRDESFSMSVQQALSSSQSPPANVPPQSFSNIGAPGHTYQASTYSQLDAPPSQSFQPGLGDTSNVQAVQRNLRLEEEADLAYMHNEHTEDAGSKRVRFTDPNDTADNPWTHNSPTSGDVPSHKDLIIKQELQMQEQAQAQVADRRISSDVPPQYEALPPLDELATKNTVEAPLRQNPTPSPTQDTRFLNQRRVPAPSVDPSEEERTLNAAAVREVTREFAALNASAPLSIHEPPGQERSSLSHPSSQPSKQGNDSLPPASSYAPPELSPLSGIDSPTLPYDQHNVTPITHSQQTVEPAQQQSSSTTTQDPQHRLGSSPRPSLLQGPPRNPSLSALSPSPYQAPYSSPSESPRSRATSGTPSLSSQVPSGARTISAAAFKRPQRILSTDIPPSSELGGARVTDSPLKKSLPSSPYPQRDGSPIRRGRSGSPAQRQPPPNPEPSQALPPVPMNQEDEYDYLGAYVDAGQGSPVDIGPGSLGPLKVANSSGEQARPKQGGYGDGKFATDLER